MFPHPLALCRRLIPLPLQQVRQSSLSASLPGPLYLESPSSSGNRTRSPNEYIQIHSLLSQQNEFTDISDSVYCIDSEIYVETSS
jgi:3-methyladenine DNA glycosylase AlkC